MAITVPTTQLLINGTWTSVSTLVGDGITITGGQPALASVADPLLGRATIRNDNGDLYPRNPRSPYFGLLRRGVRARVVVPYATHLWLFDSTSVMSTPDTAALDITGDLDVRVDVQALDWLADGGLSLGGKYLTSGNQRSWTWWVNTDLTVSIRWSPDGTLASAITTTSTAPIVPAGDGRISIRVVLDVDNGGGTKRVAFYTCASGVSGPWVQLGDQVITSGTTSVYSSTADLKIGLTGVSIGWGPTRFHAYQVRSSIGGVVVANLATAAATPGESSVVDSAGRTWTVGGNAELRDYDVRCSGEVAEWPARWTTSMRRVTASIEIGGHLRALARPSAPLLDPLARAITAATNLPYVLAYWRMTDADGATTLASGVGRVVATWRGGTPELASVDTVPGSDPMLGLTPGVIITCPVTGSTGSGQLAYRGVFDIPLSGWFDGAIVAAVAVSSGSVAVWRLMITTGGGLRLRGVAADGTTVVESGALGFSVFDTRGMIGFSLDENGGGVDWSVFHRKINSDQTITETGIDGTFGVTLAGRPRELTVSDGTLDGGGCGHQVVGENTSLATGLDSIDDAGTYIDALTGYLRERAASRATRIGRELNITVRIIGDPAESEPLGAQPSGKAEELFQAIALAERGILGEARDDMVLLFVTRASLYNRDARLPLTYGQQGESPTLEPEEPLADVVNTYTATRRKGTSYTATEPSGPLGAADYPTGVGPRPGGDELQLADDDQVQPAAWWETHLGTWDEPRYKITVPVWKLDDAGKPELSRAATACMPGDRIVITTPPPPLPTLPIDAQVRAWEETYRPGPEDDDTARTKLVFTTVPNRPWMVGVVGVDPIESDGTTLDADIISSDTALVVDVVGELWPTSGATPFVAVIRDAERVTVTAISGGSSPQTFTVTRGLDGGEAFDHPAGSAVTLYQPLRWAR